MTVHNRSKERYDKRLKLLAGRLWHTFNPNTWESRLISEFESSLIYRASSRTARDTQRNPVSEREGEKGREREREREREA